MATQISIHVEIRGSSLFAELAYEEGSEYAFYVKKNGEFVEKFMYSSSNRLEYRLQTGRGIYSVLGFVKDHRNEKKMIQSGTVHYFGEQVELGNVEWMEFEEGPFQVQAGDFLFHGLFHRNASHSDRLFVLLSAAIPKGKKIRPYFNRWAWRHRFPGHVVCIADPTLMVNQNLLIGWYLGSKEHDATDGLALLVDSIAKGLNIEPKHVVTYGSSAAGFVSLALGLRLEDICCVAINAQTIITEYIDEPVNELSKTLFDGMPKERLLEEYKYRISMPYAYGISQKARVLLVQNTADRHHWTKHYGPLCEVIKVPVAGGLSADGRNISMLYTHESGHAAETEEVFEEILEICALLS